jgi:hypothetical protein
VSEHPHIERFLDAGARDLALLYETAFVVRQVASLDLKTCRRDDDPAAVRNFMNREGFDVLPLDEGGPIERYVEAGLCGPRCGDSAQVIRAGNLIADSAPLSALLGRMRQTSWQFVLVGDHVGGIVTHADLQKAPVRLWLFGLVSVLEMHLLALARALYANDTWQDCLSPARVDKANALFAQRRARNEEIDLADCLQFCDKRDLVLGRAEGRAALAFDEVDRALSFLKSAESLRNRLAHAQDITSGTDWPSVIDLALGIQSTLARLDEWRSRPSSSN